MTSYQDELAELMPETSTPVSSQGAGINVRRLVKLRGRMMAAIFLLITIPSVVLVALFVPSHYVASADIEFRAAVPSILRGQSTNISGTAAYESFVNTQISLITGFTILSRVAESDEIKNLPSLRHASGAIVPHLMEHIEAQAQDQTELVTFSYKDPDADSALFILNKILDTYSEYVSQQEVEQGERRRQILVEREARLVEAIEKERNRIAALRKEYGIPVSEAIGLSPLDMESNRIGLSQAEADLSSAESKVRQTESLIKRVEALREQYQSNPEAPLFALGIEEKVLADPNVLQLIEQLARVQQEYSTLDETYVSTAPQVEVKRQELTALEAKLASVKAAARGNALGSLIGQYEYDLAGHQSEVESAKERRDRFNALIEEQQQGNLSRAGNYAEIDMMEKRVEDMRTDLREIRNTINSIDIESNAPARANVLGEAAVSDNADQTERIKFLLVAVMFAVMAAALAGLLAEYRDQNVRSSEDVSYVTSLPVLASIPHASEDRLPAGVNAARITDEFPDSMTADEFRRAAGRILASGRGRRQIKTCMIASPTRGDGKTTLACNLAVILAQAGRKVLLLDVDSRTPSVEERFGLKPAAGLAELLAGKDIPRDPNRRTPYPNLHIMGPGLRSTGLLERLASLEMEDFMAGAAEVFDHIIIDTPASLLMSEPKLLAPLADGIVLVTGAGVSSFGMLGRAIKVMRESEGNLIGIVVNAVRQSPGGYMRRNIDQYYGQSFEAHRRSTQPHGSAT